MEKQMRRLKLASLGLIFAALLFSSSAPAESMKNGSVYVFMPGGKMKKLSMPDKAKLMEMLKDVAPTGAENLRSLGHQSLTINAPI